MTLLLLGVGVAMWPARVRFALSSRPAFERRHLLVALVPVLLSAVWWSAGTAVLVSFAAVGSTIGFLWRRTVSTKTADQLRRDLAAAIEVVLGELRTGASPAAACDAAAEESSGTVQRVFAEAASRTRLGGSCGASLLVESGRPGEDVQRIGAAWSLAERHGIPVADVLDAARRDIAARLRFDATVHSSLAGARATAVVLSGLPVFGIALGEAMGARPIAVLLGDGFGGVLLALGCAFACAGLLWTHAIAASVRA